MKKIKLLIFMILLSFCGYTQYYRHYVGVKLGGGLSTLNYKLLQGSPSKGIGGTGGVSYTYFITSFIGIGTGIEAAYYRSKASLSYFGESYPSIDSENESFIFNLYLNNYLETQHFIALQIPLFLRFEIENFSIALGAKIGIPLKTSYTSNIGRLQTTGKYANCDDPFENMPNHGYYELMNLKNKARLDLGLDYMLSAEIGYNFKTSKNMRFFVGVYADYGLNDLRKTKDVKGSLFAYNPESPKDLQQNSILYAASLNGKSNQLQGFSSKVNSLALGIVFRYSFGFVPFTVEKHPKLIDYPENLRLFRKWRRKSVLEDNEELRKEMERESRSIKRR